MSESDTILFPTLDDLVTDSLVHTKSMFLNNYPQKTPDFSQASKLKLKSKMISDYGGITLGDKEMTSFSSLIQRKFQLKQLKQDQSEENQSKTAVGGILDSISSEAAEKLSKIPQKFLIKNDDEIRQTQSVQIYEGSRIPGILATRQKKVVKPDWHAPWKLMRVISGHQGWVRCVTVDPSNQWFATGSNDRTIKIWDLATGQLKLTLTGHINTVRDLAISPKHMYLFSCGEDKTVRCWDLEYNKVVRNYHGHLSGVYCLTLHPSLDVIVSGGRDSTCRVWDIRTRSQIHALGGHSHVVSSVISQEFEPQVVSGSHDDTIRLWDLSMGKTIHTLTNHKKAVRGMIFHPSEYTFISAAHDNVKVWKCPEGEFLRNISGHKEILNTVSINRDNVLVAGGDKGSLHFWDYKTGHQFQTIKSTVQPGSISAEAGIFQCTFDKSSLRLITAECDKTIKIWKEDETATPETHPVGNIKLNMDTYGNH